LVRDSGFQKWNTDLESEILYMFAFIFSFIFFLSGAASSGGGSGFDHFWETYINNPSFPLWKFFNLAVFVGLMVYLLKKPLSETFKAKREEIRTELIKAEEEKQAALAKLTEIEVKSAGLENEKNNIRLKAQVEADNEVRRIAEQTETDIAKMRNQADNEVSRMKQQAQGELRKFSAEESVRLAEKLIKEKLGSSSDAQIVKAGIENLGGAK
jgi:F-type H+-transporting ATPase subunit b